MDREVPPAGEILYLRRLKTRFLYILVLVCLLAACGGAATETTPTSSVAGRTTVPTSVVPPTNEPADATVPAATEQATTVVPVATATATPAPAPTSVAVVSPNLSPTSLPTTIATAEPRDPVTRAVNVPDFEMVAYQGQKVLGGSRTKFSQVFKQGRPVVLNFWRGQ